MSIEPAKPAATIPAIEIRYSLGRDDVIAFNLHHASTSPTAQRTRRRVIGWVVVALTVWMVLSCYRQWLETASVVSTISHSAFFFLSIFLFLAIWTRLNRWTVRRHVRSVWDEGKNKAIIGDHVLRVAEDAIYGESAYVSSRMSWELIERVDVLKDHVFLYISSFNAFILPRAAFTSATQLLEFLQLVGRHAGVSVACPQCAYNLRGTQGGRCPECGFPERE